MSIRLLAIVKAEDVSKYGQNDILTPIVNDIHTLADGKPVELFCAVMSSLGDTEGQHQWGGFKVKVGLSHQKCRNCLCTFIDMQQKFRDSDFTERNLAQYHHHCRDIETAPNNETRKSLEHIWNYRKKSAE